MRDEYKPIPLDTVPVTAERLVLVDPDSATVRHTCLRTGSPADAPTVVTCRCASCWAYLCDLEAGAICEQGFLTGCHTCGA